MIAREDLLAMTETAPTATSTAAATVTDAGSAAGRVTWSIAAPSAGPAPGTTSAASMDVVPGPAIFVQRYEYTGRELASESGYYFFRFRVYGPALGQFLTRDPLGYVDGMALYAAYFGQAMTVDPEGLETHAEKCVRERKEFVAWLANEQKAGIGWTNGLPDCPCTIPVPNQEPTNPDPAIWTDPTDWLWGFHQGARWCMRSRGTGNAKNPKPGQQCCYDCTGWLITWGKGAGTPDKVNPDDLNWGAGGHQQIDVDPAKMAQRLDACFPRQNPSYILQYNSVRPPNPGKGTDGKPCPRNP